MAMRLALYTLLCNLAGAKDAHSPGFKENAGAALDAAGGSEAGRTPAAQANEDVPSGVTPPAPKRRAIVSESDDE